MQMLHSGNRTNSYVSLKHPDYLSDDYSCEGTAFKSFENYSCVVSEQNPFVYWWRLPDNHRAHIKTIVRFVYDLHMCKDNRMSLESLDESNIVFHHHQLKLRGLKFVKGASVEDRARDYKLLHILLIKLLDKYYPEHYKRPTGVDQFLSRLQECSESKNLRSATIAHEYLLANHWLLLDYKIKLAATKNFDDKKSSICIPEDKTRYHTALKEMQRREDYKTGDWTKGLSGPALRCLNYKPPPKKSKYVGVGEDNKVVNRNILRFCRNMETHLHQHIPKPNNDPKFDVEKEKYWIIMDLFEDELMSFYHKTLEYGIAHYFIPPGGIYTRESTRCSSVEQHHTPSTANHGGGGGGNAEGWKSVQNRKQKK